MGHCAAHKGLIAIPTLKHADKFTSCQIVREASRVLCESFVKGDGNLAIVSRHVVVFVFACVEATAVRRSAFSSIFLSVCALLA